jgi:DNA adenine methylase
LYDDIETLFYFDPPYLHATRGESNAYAYEMDEAQHRPFAKVINACKGLVAVSGYDHSLMDEFFDPGKWKKSFEGEKAIHSTKDMRQEVLWTNYDPQTMRRIAA